MRVVVIGGGIVGASAAYHLAGRGADVVLVDRAHAGKATDVGSGVVFPGPIPGTSGAEFEFGSAAFESLLSTMAALERDGGGSGAAQVGMMAVAQPGAELDAMLEQSMSLLDMPGMGHVDSVTALDVGEPRDRIALLRPDLAGAFISGFVRLDGRRFAEALLNAAGRRGLQLRPGTATLARERDAVSVRVDDVPQPADAVLVAAGAWSAELCRPLGLDLPVVPHRGQGVRLGAADVDTDRWPIVQPPDWNFLVPLPGGRVVAGGTSEPGAGFDTTVRAVDVPDLVATALDVAPGLADWTVVEHRAGLRPASLDGKPLLGRCRRLPALVVATGLDTMGLSHGPYAGALAADLVLGLVPDADLEPFRPDRRAGPPP